MPIADLVECVSGYCELTLGNGDGLEGRGADRVDRKEKHLDVLPESV